MSGIRDIWLHAHNMIRSGRQIINKNLHPLGISSAEGNILLHLLTQGHEMAQEQLVDQLDVSKPAISRALASLEEKGYRPGSCHQLDGYYILDYYHRPF